jgi:hypothetical protein
MSHSIPSSKSPTINSSERTSLFNFPLISSTSYSSFPDDSGDVDYEVKKDNIKKDNILCEDTEILKWKENLVL